MTVGETLKRARKKMGLSLDDVADATKIAKMFLIALESDDISLLPSGVYARNFLRTYAKFLKLDEDILTSEYHQQFHVVPHFVAQQEQTKHDDREFRRNRRRLQVFGSISGVLLLILLYFLWQSYGDEYDFWSFSKKTKVETVAPATPNPLMTREESKPAPSEPINPQPAVNKEPEPNKTTAETNEIAEPVVPVDEDDAVDPVPASDDDTPAEDVDNESSVETEDESTVKPIEAVSLPIETLAGIDWLPAGSIPSSFDEIFAIEARGRVWIQVIIDEKVETERYLKAGEVRYYKYGTTNSLIVGDSSMVAIQDGHDYRADFGSRSRRIKASEFGQGQLMSHVNTALGN